MLLEKSPDSSNWWRYLNFKLTEWEMIRTFVFGNLKVSQANSHVAWSCLVLKWFNKALSLELHCCVPLIVVFFLSFLCLDPFIDHVVPLAIHEISWLKLTLSFAAGLFILVLDPVLPHDLPTGGWVFALKITNQAIQPILIVNRTLGGEHSDLRRRGRAAR